MMALTLLLTLAFAVLPSIAQDQQCYWRSNHVVNVESDGWFACNNTQQIEGGAQLCCLSGSQCGTDAICHQSTSGGNSGWFVGGCTDPTYQDPACRTSCTGDSSTWIQYNYTSQLWQCCGDDGCSGTPTLESFQASPPEQFSAVPSGPQSSTSSSVPTTTSTGSPMPAPATELSTGAKAGIGVAAAVAGIAIAVAIAFFILWRRAKKANAPSQRPEDRWHQEQGMQQHQQQQHVYAHYASQPANYYQPPPPAEVGTNEPRRPELAGEESGTVQK